MHQDIIKQLKKLRAVEPDAEFVRRSRSLLFREATPVLAAFPFASVTRRQWNMLGLAAGFALLMIAILSPFTLGDRHTLSALSAEAINREFDNLSINVQLEEMTFNENARDTIASAITEITDNKTQHLSSQLLETEIESFDIPAEDSDEINELLREILGE